MSGASAGWAPAIHGLDLGFARADINNGIPPAPFSAPRSSTSSIHLAAWIVLHCALCVCVCGVCVAVLGLFKNREGVSAEIKGAPKLGDNISTAGEESRKRGRRVRSE